MTEDISMEDLDGLPPIGMGHNGGPPLNEPIYVFVYGSLLKGFPNNYLLGGNEIKGSFVTSKRYKMINLGPYPAVVKAVKPVTQQEKYRPILGEVYEVTQHVFGELDFLEGNGEFYQRELVDLQGFNHKVWMYILMNNSYGKSTRAVRPCASLDSSKNYSWEAQRELNREIIRRQEGGTHTEN